MATINQIRKQIETAEKRLAKAEKNVAMYDARIDSAIARAAKATGRNVTRDNYNETVPSRPVLISRFGIPSNPTLIPRPKTKRPWPVKPAKSPV